MGVGVKGGGGEEAAGGETGERNSSSRAERAGRAAEQWGSACLLPAWCIIILDGWMDGWAVQTVDGRAEGACVWWLLLLAPGLGSSESVNQ